MAKLDRVVVYLAHPVAPVPGGPTVAENVTNALAWLKCIVLASRGWAVCAPWIPYVQVLEDSGKVECPIRRRGMADDLAVLERCDFMVMVGGRISRGMQGEKEHAEERGIPVFDWTSAGYRVPLTEGVTALLALSTHKEFLLMKGKL